MQRSYRHMGGWLVIRWLAITWLGVSTLAAQSQRMTPELLWKLGRLGPAALSADGQQVAYGVRHYDLAANRGTSSLHVYSVATQETTTPLSGWRSISDLQFAPASPGEQLYFIGLPPAMEGAPETAQVYSWRPGSESPRQVTTIDGGVANLKVSPDGQQLAFTRDVKLDPTVAEVYPDLPLADARIIDQLMFRHWDSWHDYSYSHVHVATLQADGAASVARDLMPGMRVDCPVPPFGGAEQFAWAPDSREIALTLKEDPRWAESTNSDVYLVSVADPAQRVNVSASNIGYDRDPVFSPDGKTLAYHSMERPGFEADRNRVMLYDRGTRSLSEATAGLDQPANTATWAADSQSFFIASENRGTDQIYRLRPGRPGVEQVTDGQFNWGLVAPFPDGKRLLLKKESMIHPSELAILDWEKGQTEVISHINDALLKDVALPTVQERWVTASDGQRLHCWVVYPPDFDPAKKWPMLLYCQGGPQSQIGQWFSYRWNFHLMAAQGYVVLAPNRRGLPGFGQAWNDAISGDWGGQAMRDLLSATDDLSQESYIDPARRAAVGASFGGYSVYWLMGNSENRFACMIAHCGVFDLRSMYGSTEELFFVNWDLGGPYWKNPEAAEKYEAFSPSKYIGNWSTPLLVIHGEKDFRVPVTQGMQAFTAAQVQRVPSRFLYFPGEGHWVNSPQNSVLWNRVFFDWLGRYCHPKQANPSGTTR